MGKSKRYLTNQELQISDLFPQKETGKCCFCSKKLTGKQRKWCSEECSFKAFDETMFARGSSTHIRKIVFARDKGICANCGVDGERLQRISDFAHKSLIDLLDSTIPKEDWWWRSKENSFKFYSPRDEKHKEYFKEVRKLWKTTALTFGGSCWQADHILEVKNGGQHIMDNLQTLCSSCHKTKTRKMYQV